MQEDPNIIYDCIKEGALIQVNASSILGRGPKEANKLCDVLLNHNMIHFIATDAHSSNRRAPKIKDTYDYIMDKYGEDRANELFKENANKIIQDELLENLEEPIRYNPKQSFFKKIFKKK